MRHAFTTPYRNDLGEHLTRCFRCGVGSHWEGARDRCSGKYSSVDKETSAPRRSAAQQDRRLRESVPGLLTADQAASALGVSRRWVYAMVERGQLRAVRRFGRSLFDAAEVRARATAPTQAHPWSGKAVVPTRSKGVQ